MKKKLNRVAQAVSALVLSLSAAWATAQSSVPVEAAENGRLWFVELAGKPVADGSSRSAVQAEKAAFRQAARSVGVNFKERFAYDVLFNGFAVEIEPGQRAALARIAGVKAMYPVERIEAPTPEQAAGSAADLASALNMTGARIAQNSLGLTGAGIKVGIVDTGIDIDHPAFGGNGSNKSTPFPSARVAYGYDFVGDAYDSGGTGAALVPQPDANPDDCAGHGTHVAGIVGANGGGLTGVAPGVTLGAYRVFGCTGTTSADIIVAALERAYADGMQVINQSLGASRQWPQYPTAQASSRLVDKGVVMVASIGNNGPGGSSPDGLFAAGAPGVGEKVIGVASYDNLQSTQLAFTINPGATLIGFNAASGAPPAPVAGTKTLSKPATITGCTAADFAGFPAGNIALIQRGTCTFYVKAFNAMTAGASAVVLYNNAAGALSPTVAATPPDPAITIPVVAITQAQGTAIAALASPMLTWGTSTVSTPVPTGGLISGFSSFGLSADLNVKPNVGAPGGLIYSSYPLELGAYATLSGTSMSSPHVAGGVALIKQARPDITAPQMMAYIQNTADPKNWSGAPSLGFLDFVHRQGAGMLDIVATVQSTTLVEPSQIALGESEAGPKTTRITVKNAAAGAVSYDLSHQAALASGPNNACGATTCPASYGPGSTFNAPATVSFSTPSITVPGRGSASFDVTVAANAGLANRSLYGGYVTLTPQAGGETLRVPYAGLVGDYQSTQILTPTPNGFPWLAQLSGTSLQQRAAGGTYTLTGNDLPYFLLHLDHHARKIEFSVFNAANGKPVHPVFNTTDLFEYVGRNATPGGFFAFTWDGTRMHDNGKGTPDHRKVVPNGQYKIVMRVLKPLGDEGNAAHWETWTSPTITLARP